MTDLMLYWAIGALSLSALVMPIIAARYRARLLKAEAELRAHAAAPLPQATRVMLGLETPGDKQVPVSVRDWNAMRRALWRSAKGWEIVANTASDIIADCEHIDGCPGIDSDDAPCKPDRNEVVDGAMVLAERGCPDRETRMSALVVLSAALQHAPRDVNKPTDEYFAPSREYFSEVLSSLVAAQVEIEHLQEKLQASTTAPKEIE